MNIENRLSEALREKGEEIQPSQELKRRVMNSIHTDRRSMKKRVMGGVLALFLLLPAGVLASQSFLADELYGSFENAKKHIASATMEGYLRLDAKLAQAKGELGKEEYKEFITLVKQVSAAKIEHGNQFGNIDYDVLPNEKAAELEKVLFNIQPYFDTLNGQPSSREVLSESEYWQYIHALMTYEKILVQSEIDPSQRFEVEAIPIQLRADFLAARDFLTYVNEKQAE